MKSSKLLTATLVALSVAFTVGCTKEQNNETASSHKTADGLSVYERAKIARSVRKIEKEEKRKLIEHKYAHIDDEPYSVKAYFEDELVDSKDLVMWIQPGFIGVLKNYEDNPAEEALLLVNDAKNYNIVVDYSNNNKKTDISSNDFCKDLVSKATKHSNVNMVVPPSLLSGKNSSICRLSYKDIAANRFVNEFTEVSADGSVFYFKTSTGNSNISGRDIIKQAFSRVTSDRLKTAVRHATAEFYDTEKYGLTDI